MTVIEQLKIIDNIFKSNQAQYDPDRLVAKIPALLLPDELRKYEFLTRENTITHMY